MQRTTMPAWSGFALASFVGVAACATAQARPLDDAPMVDLDVRLGNPVLLAREKSNVFLKVSLVGQAARARARRAPINICLAIDKSGSMTGEKIAQAREGALAAVRRLEPLDTISVVAYDDTVEVLVPANSGAERAEVVNGIRSLYPGGSTALFAGVAKCAEEVRRGLDRDRVNRIILLSDGQANVGPSSPAALGALGAQLMDEGISVSTVGIGLDYNEDLMTELALRSDGGHTFVRNPSDLAAFLDEELSSVTSVVARDVDVRIRCRNGIRPVRVLGRPADIAGDTVTAAFGKIYAGREHFMLIELDVPPTGAGSERSLADVDVTYRDLIAGRKEKRNAAPRARFSPSRADVDRAVDRKVMGVVELAMADLATARALELRDQGQAEAAREVLRTNTARLNKKAREYRDPRLNQAEKRQKNELDKLPENDDARGWQEQRKHMKHEVTDQLLNGIK
jgi:Ca-activated chloride channel family protein